MPEQMQQTPTPEEAAMPQEQAVSSEQAQVDHYDRLLDPKSDLSHLTVEGAAQRPEVEMTDAKKVQIETDRQMGTAAADRNNRQDAGLPPRTFDLK